jgi:hypothetical protein
VANFALFKKRMPVNQGIRTYQLSNSGERVSKWTGADYAKGLFAILDDFTAIRRCWGGTEPG